MILSDEEKKTRVSEAGMHLVAAMTPA